MTDEQDKDEPEEWEQRYADPWEMSYKEQKTFDNCLLVFTAIIAIVFILALFVWRR